MMFDLCLVFKVNWIGPSGSLGPSFSQGYFIIISGLGFKKTKANSGLDLLFSFSLKLTYIYFNSNAEKKPNFSGQS